MSLHEWIMLHHIFGAFCMYLFLEVGNDSIIVLKLEFLFIINISWCTIFWLSHFCSQFMETIFVLLLWVILILCVWGPTIGITGKNLYQITFANSLYYNHSVWIAIVKFEIVSGNELYFSNRLMLRVTIKMHFFLGQ